MNFTHGEFSIVYGPTKQAVEDVLFGAEGIPQGLKPSSRAFYGTAKAVP
jgi:hypothetical protein